MHLHSRLSLTAHWSARGALAAFLALYALPAGAGDAGVTGAVKAPEGVQARVQLGGKPGAPTTVHDRSDVSVLQPHLDRLAESALSPRQEPPSWTLVVPQFEVETGNPGGLTTLIAVRNPHDKSIPLAIEYTDPEFEVIDEDTPMIAPHGTFTRNLRDISGLEPDDDGVARGMVWVFALEGDSPVTGDFFRVDPAGNFATGDRMMIYPTDVPGLPMNPHQEYCRNVDVRYGIGGLFDDTVLTFGVRTPGGSQSGCPEEDATVHMDVYDEAGDHFGQVNICPDFFGFSISMSFINDLFEDAGASMPAFGALEITFQGTVGSVSAESSADGRFSVGLKGTCTRE